MHDIDMREQVGVAINARAQTADSVGDVAMTIGALARVDELGALLVRMKYGDDKRRSGMHRAVLLLAKRERSSAKFKRGKYIEFKREARQSHEKPLSSISDIVERFAFAVLDAWLDDMCGACRGRGTTSAPPKSPTLALSCPTCRATGRVAIPSAGTIPYCSWPHGLPRNEQLQRGVRYSPPTAGAPIVEFLNRSVVDVCGMCKGIGRVAEPKLPEPRCVCEVCQGSGKRWQIPAQRAHAMGVSLPLFELHWSERFERALRMLSALDEWTDRRLREQMIGRPLAKSK